MHLTRPAVLFPACLVLLLMLSGCEPETPVITTVNAPTAPVAVAEAAPAEHPEATEEVSLETGLINPGYEQKPDWFVDSFLDIREDVAEAAAVKKRVVLYFYQDGCPYCRKLLDTNLALKGTAGKMRNGFNVIAINMWGDREVTDFNGGATTEKEFARALRVMFTPTLLFLDEQGGVVLRINGYYAPHKFNAALDYAVTNSGVSPTFREYYTEVSPSPASGKLHSNPAFLSSAASLAARESGKPLLVLFEQQECAPCDELHTDILQRPESREQLERLDVVLLDMWSNDPVGRPDGKSSSAAEWARELDVKYAPSLVFFNAQGEEVFRTEAWLKSFHIQSVMDYVSSGAYLEQPSFQRFIAARADALEAQGIHVDLMD
ncbi:MAG: thioredoxin fold domain-containing protein [Pseudomonadota bacterium]